MAFDFSKVNLGAVDLVKEESVINKEKEVTNEVVVNPEVAATKVDSEVKSNDEKQTSLIEEVENDEEIKQAEKTEVSSKKTKKQEPMKFNGPRRVIVYGQELFIEEDPDISLDDIRKRLVKEYKYTEFADASKVNIHFDAKTGEVFPMIELKKKG